MPIKYNVFTGNFDIVNAPSGSSGLGAAYVVHKDGTTTAYNAASDSNIARGTALLAAVAAIATGDSIYLTANTFDIQTGRVDLTSGNVNLIGSGKFTTIVKGSRTTAPHNFIVEIGNNVCVANMSIVGTNGSGFCLPIGSDNSDSLNFVFSNLYIFGKTDCMYFGSGFTSTGDIYGVDAASNWDVLYSENAGTINVYNTNLTATADAAVNTGSNCEAVYNNEGGTINLLNVIATATGASINNYGFFNKSGTMNIFSGKSTTSGTDAQDLKNDSGTLAITASLAYGVFKVSALPAITYLDSNQIVKSVGNSNINFGIGTNTPESAATLIGATYINGTGTIADDGGGNITGTDTIFLSEIQVGMSIFCPDTGDTANVVAVIDDTHMTLDDTVEAPGSTFTYKRAQFSMLEIVSRDNNDYTNDGGAGSHIFMNNLTGGQNVVSSAFAGVVKAKWRTDSNGNINWVSAADTSGEGHLFFINGDYPTGNVKMKVTNSGVLIGDNQVSNSPTAYLTIAAGTATAGTAPLKFTSGTLLTSPEVGSIEYNGKHYFTNPSIRFPVGGTLFDHYADVSNATTTETDLYTDTIAASTLGNNGDKICADYTVSFAGHPTALSRVRIYFAGTVIYDSTASAIAAADSDSYRVRIIRESSSVVRCIVDHLDDDATLADFDKYTRITGLTLSGTNILKITGQMSGTGAASNQITARMGYVEFKPAA